MLILSYFRTRSQSILSKIETCTFRKHNCSNVKIFVLHFRELKGTFFELIYVVLKKHLFEFRDSLHFFFFKLSRSQIE